MALCAAGCNRSEGSEATPRPQEGAALARAPGLPLKTRAQTPRDRAGETVGARADRRQTGAGLRRQLNRKVAGCVQRLHEAHPHAGGILAVELQLRGAGGDTLRVQSLEEGPDNTLGEPVLFQCLEAIVVRSEGAAPPGEPIRLTLPVQPLSH